MNAPIATTAIALALAAPALAQGPASGGRPTQAAARTSGPATAAATTTKDPKVFPAQAALPEPAKPEEVEKPSIPLPNEPIEPYLLTPLTKDAGPFMIMAFTFRGPNSAKYAQALAIELRNDYQLPAWVFLPKLQPMRSNIRGIPPTAPYYVKSPNITPPEGNRIFDEAAVLVGNCKTLAESVNLLCKVKTIHPKCLKNYQDIYLWRRDRGLSRALRTTNPFVPAQYLYPRKVDPLLAQMNDPKHNERSVANCPGRFSLQVAEFTGRTFLQTGADKEKPVFKLDSFLKKSPLLTAAEDAQKLADNLAKVDRLQRAGYQAYVYHDRTSSKVLVGAFNRPDDPGAQALRQAILEVSPELFKKGQADSNLMPAPDLLDLKTLAH